MDYAPRQANPLVEGMGKRKFTAEQAREALLATGEEMLHSVGPAGVATVSLAEAINRSGVPRPSAYRVFGGGDLDPQRNFQEELVLRVIASEPGISEFTLRQVVDPFIVRAETLEGADISDRLTELLVELVTASAGTVIEHLIDDSRYGVYLSATALARVGAGSDRIEQALGDYRDALSSNWQAYYRDIMSAFGLRLRPGWTDSDLFVVFNDATVGAVLAAKTAARLPAPNGDSGTAAWLTATYAALTALATEPDTRRIASAQPMRMLEVTPGALVPSA